MNNIDVNHNKKNKYRIIQNLIITLNMKTEGVYSKNRSSWNLFFQSLLVFMDKFS